MKELPDMTKDEIEIFSCLDSGTVTFTKKAVCVRGNTHAKKIEFLKNKKHGKPETLEPQKPAVPFDHVYKVSDPGICEICAGGVFDEFQGGVPIGYVLEANQKFHLVRLHRKDLKQNVQKKNARGGLLFKDDGSPDMDYTDFNGAWWSFGDLSSIKADGYVISDTKRNSAVCSSWGELTYVTFVELAQGTHICVGATQSMDCDKKDDKGVVIEVLDELPATQQMQVYMGRRIQNTVDPDTFTAVLKNPGVPGAADTQVKFKEMFSMLESFTCAASTLKLACASCAEYCWDTMRLKFGFDLEYLDDNINALI